MDADSYTSHLYSGLLTYVAYTSWVFMCISCSG